MRNPCRPFLLRTLHLQSLLSISIFVLSSQNIPPSQSESPTTPYRFSSLPLPAGRPTACNPPHLRADETIFLFSPRYEHLRVHTPPNIDRPKHHARTNRSAQARGRRCPSDEHRLARTRQRRRVCPRGMNDLPDSSAIQAPTTAQGEEMEIVDEEDRPHFPQVQNDDSSFRAQSRKIPIPPHRFSPLKSNWPQIYRTSPTVACSYCRGRDFDLQWLIAPLVENLKLAVR